TAAFTGIRRRIASNKNLNDVGHASNFNAFVILPNGQVREPTIPPATMAATVEAIIGAVYLDSKSLDTVKTVMITMGLVADPPT
ncbi:MAG: hypothetical protein Q9202_007092, partial [Teloschistes flavicans]